MRNCLRIRWVDLIILIIVYQLIEKLVFETIKQMGLKKRLRCLKRICRWKEKFQVTIILNNKKMSDASSFSLLFIRILFTDSFLTKVNFNYQRN